MVCAFKWCWQIFLWFKLLVVVRFFIIMPRPVGGGALGGHQRPSVRPSVCLSDVAYIGSNSKTKRRRKTKLFTGVPQVTCDSHTDFKVKRSKVKVTGRAYCGGHLAAQLVLLMTFGTINPNIHLRMATNSLSCMLHHIHYRLMVLDWPDRESRVCMQPNIFTGFDSGIMSDPPNRDPPPLAEQFNHCTHNELG